MGRVILVRHGETAWNREEVFRGRTDVELSELGRDQARLLAEALCGGPIEAVYSSPLSRAVDTARPLADTCTLEVNMDERLTDMSFGEWEGRPRTEVEQADPTRHRTWLTEPQMFRAPGGESLADVLGRAWPALSEIAARHPDGCAAVISHRVVCKLLLCAALGAGEAAFWRIRVDTASISELNTGGDHWVVASINETHHLTEVGEEDQSDF
jgi:broad specificity phosphatase PhoE